jgi:probable HAF family extracellular repeat protein
MSQSLGSSVLLPNGGSAIPTAINSSNIIVGSSDGASGTVAVQFTSGKKGPGVTLLGTLGSKANPAGNSAALGINSAGQIVGYCDLASGSRAFIYQNGVMTDLNNSIVPGQNGGFLTLSQATAINDNGAIVGYGLRTASGPYFAFLAIPTVPTPHP